MTLGAGALVRERRDRGSILQYPATMGIVAMAAFVMSVIVDSPIAIAGSAVVAVTSVGLCAHMVLWCFQNGHQALLAPEQTDAVRHLEDHELTDDVRRFLEGPV